METLSTDLSTNNEEFQANSKFHKTFAENLRAKLAAAREGGGADARTRHTAISE